MLVTMQVEAIGSVTVCMGWITGMDAVLAWMQHEAQKSAGGAGRS
ncbi:hypothetical protein ACFV9E_09050 [Streptomyces sp. NPDC059835]